MKDSVRTLKLAHLSELIALSPLAVTGKKHLSLSNRLLILLYLGLRPVVTQLYIQSSTVSHVFIKPRTEIQ